MLFWAFINKTDHLNRVIRQIEGNSSCKTIFTDFYDTLVHRTVHPQYAIKLWGKFMIRELGLMLTADELFAIRIDSLAYLGQSQKKRILEVSYDSLIKEIYSRLINIDSLPDTDFGKFKTIFEQSDYISEISVQFKNDELVDALFTLKKKGYRVYLVTDFFFSKKLMRRIIDFHDMLPLFDDVFVSCEMSKSKEGSEIYPAILEEIKAQPEDIIMIGDNEKSDVINAAKFKIKSIHTKHSAHHFRNKKNLLGHDGKNFKKACSQVERSCRKSEHQFSEYIIHFYFFIERLYKKARRDNVNNLFFLAREGLYLKALFDFYQELNQFEHTHKIQTHYLKASRQSAQQIALKPLDEESFDGFKTAHRQMSADQLLQWFLFSEEIKITILNEVSIDNEQVHENIFESDVMKKLRENLTFRENYESNRKQQKQAFTSYIASFKAPIEHEGIALVDVGWGGTMQECIYAFFGKKIPVTGYYIGLKEIYNIETNTKRFGLNFSLYPSHGSSFDILKANGQLYEQLLGAPHGSTLGYKFDNEVPTTVEFHEESEKFVFDSYIKDVQNHMIVEFERLFLTLRPINYSEDMVQDYMTDMALRIGIFTNKKKIRFINDLSKGFYQNVGKNAVGLAYDPSQLKSPKRALLKTFIRTPEKVFRYIVKIKPYMYSKNLYWLSSPLNLTYYYIKFNFWVKKKWFPKNLLR